MQGLTLTFDTLGKTRNEAAVEVLLAALWCDDAKTRGRALSTLLCRTEARACQKVLAGWDRLQAEELHALKQKKNWMAATIEQALVQGGQDVARAIRAARSLELTAVIGQLVMLAESSGSRPIRTLASDAILDIARPLGREARADRDQPTVRSPVLARLADSVRRFSMHHNEKLVDAFLLVATWGDGDFRQLISENSPQRDLIFKRLDESPCDSVNELLAGFIRRRRIPDRIAPIIKNRQHKNFRDALLVTIGNEPSATALRNLREIGLPDCCQGGETLMRELPPQCRAAMAHLSTATESDLLRNLHVVATAAEYGGPGCEAAAAVCFTRSEVPDIDTWMRAALPVADGDQTTIAANENARLLQRLIHLLDHPEAALVRGVRRILGPLHTEEMLHHLESLRPRSRRKLGQIITIIDPDALDRVRDALRHPVLGNRLAAIAAADALALVDLLSDSFERISRQDHQEARIRAAEAMSEATGQQTLALLREMVDLPESPVRDAAIAALGRRQTVTTG